MFCFQRFLQRFIDPTSTEDENAGLDLNEPLYMQKLEEVASLGSGCKVVMHQIEDEECVDPNKMIEVVAGNPQMLSIKYLIFVLQISVVGDPVLNVNCLHVQAFDAELYRQLICYPQVKSCIYFRDLICANRKCGK